MYKRKIAQGEWITSLDQLMACDFVIVRGKPFHSGWVRSWQIQMAHNYISRGDAFCGVRLTNEEYYDGLTDDEIRTKFDNSKCVHTSFDYWKKEPVK